MLGHIGGAPVEELVPILATGGTMLLVAARVALARLWQDRG